MSLATFPITPKLTRANGTVPMAISELARIDFYVSTDNGANFVKAGAAHPADTSFQFELTEPGLYQFYAKAVDTAGLSSVPSNTVTIAYQLMPDAPVLGVPTIS